MWLGVFWVGLDYNLYYNACDHLINFHFLQVNDRVSVPLILVSSTQKIQSLKDLFTRNNHFAFDSEKVHIISRISPFVFSFILVRYVLKFARFIFLLLYPKLRILKVQNFWLQEKNHKLEFPNYP